MTALGEWAGGVWGLLGAVEPALGAFLAPASAQACALSIPLTRSMCSPDVQIQDVPANPAETGLHCPTSVQYFLN